MDIQLTLSQPHVAFLNQRRTFVPPSGSYSQSQIAFVGEQPGEQEVRRIPRKPFIGPAGDVLTECTHNAGILRTECYITNVIKDLDHKLQHYIDLTTSSPTVSEEGKMYIEILRKEVADCSANIIVAVGNIALFALTDRIGITSWRGSILRSTLVPRKKVIPIIHPATIIPPKNQYLNKHLIIMDLVKIKKESEFPDIRYEDRKIITRPSFSESLSYLQQCRDAGEKGKIIFFDIELYNNELGCISFSFDPHEAICIPFVSSEGDYFSPEQELRIIHEISILLYDKTIIKGGQNVIFDSQFLLRKYNIISNSLEDTMVAQKTLYHEFNIGLDFITSMYTDIPYYKRDGKIWLSGVGSWEQGWVYNGMDSISCADAFPKQIKDLGKQDNMKAYARQTKMIPPLTYMMEKGIKVNLPKMTALAKVEEDKINELQEKLNQEVGTYLNPNSPKQVAEYFYIKKGITPYKEKGKVTVNEDALIRIFRKGFKEARYILDIRGAAKRRSTYLDKEKVDADSRIRFSANPVGTKFSRISTSKTIFGTGMNMQNWPNDLRQCLEYDEGYVGYEFDLSQFENRIVAYVGNVVPMINAFENDEDVHALTAALLFGGSPEQIIEDEKNDVRSPLSGGRFTKRFWGKKSNHCKLPTCQVLTKAGWVTIVEAFYRNLEIAQWDHGIIEFVLPNAWHNSYYSGDIHTITNQRIFQESTSEHRMPLLYKNRGKEKLIVKTVDNYPKSGHYYAPLSGIYLGGDVTLRPEVIQLLVAFQADGSWDSNTMIIRVTKERKLKRLHKILVSGNLPFTESQSGVYISAKLPEVQLIRHLLGKDKNFGSWLLEFSPESAKVFLDELPHWDGYLKKNQYFSTNKNNVEWVQTLCHLNNKAGNISIQDNSLTNAYGNKKLYIIRPRDTDCPATHAINRYTTKVDNIPVYCPSVPSGFFLCREHGIISITGNSLNYDEGYKTFALINEISEREAKIIVEAYHARYPEVRQNYHAGIRQQLSINRTLTNLLGRKTLFLDQWGHELFKSAYSCIPQGTCGDLINERGVEFIYYNHSLFEPVEVLLQVHDSISFQIPLSVPWIDHARMLMTIKDSLETPLEYKDREFIVPVDLTIGKNMYKKQGKEIKHKDFPTNAHILAERLKNAYESISI